MDDAPRPIESPVLDAAGDNDRLSINNGLSSLKQRAIEASANAIAISASTSAGLVLIYVNPAFERVTGYAAAEVIGRNCRFLQGEDRHQSAVAEIRAAILEERPGNAILRNYKKDGSLFWNHLFISPVMDDDGVVTHFVASQYDITATKDLEAKLLYQATHDDLTSLPNRALLRDRLTNAIATASRSSTKQKIWVAFITLDRFKSINESLGHGAGDRFLIEIGRKLSKVVRGADTVARWGGKEFVVLMPGQQEGDGTAALQRIIAAVGSPLVFTGQEYVVSCSVGVASYPEDGDQVETLLARAGAAASHAQASGANCFQFHTDDMHRRALARLELEAEIRLAVKNEEFTLHYQPQIDLASGQVVGAEALVRWLHPTRGLIPPGVFIPIAEEIGLIQEIGDWVLKTACAQNGSWQRAGLPPLRMAVNLSAAQLNPGLYDRVLEVLKDHQLSPQSLEIELTESVMMQDPARGIALLGQLSDAGVNIAIDDFGTGFSSLAYLKKLPIDLLKIDRSFVMDLGSSMDDAAIVTSIIALGHALGMRVIAEGVETEEQLSFLKRLGCDEAQGYLFSRPVPADMFENVFRSALAAD